MERSFTNIIDNKEDALRRVRVALLNILEDTEDARRIAVDEKNKTMAIIENLTDGILLLDTNGRVETISLMVESFLKKSKEEIIGIDFFDIIAGNEFKALKDLLKDGGKIKAVQRKEVEVGDNLNLEVTVVFLKTEQEEKGSLIVLHDVTRDKLIEKMKTEFVSIAAHQLRTPLSAIKWTLRMILDGDVGKITEDQKELLDKTYISNERMISLINDLLNVSRIEEGRFLYKQENMQLEDIVDGIVKSSAESLKMKNLKIDIDVPKKLIPEVFVDKEKIGLVVQNLLENAIKYSKDGGDIKIVMEKLENEASFKIIDSGVGIPENQKERIFSKFFRGDNVVALETEGSGLGLYTAKNIVEAHKGKIWFESKENSGTTFCFTLPFAKK
ncbi:MAG: ATP-binding protein [Candidatus Pacebacteria bacterium]|nr:ATP-binding protein [Candidatus Paceibacterota bacterium]